MIPSAMQAAGKASGPVHVHFRQPGAPTGWMTAHPTKKKAKRNKFAVNG